MTATEIQAGKRLEDRSASGRLKPWDRHKLMNGLLSLAYDEIDERKAERLRGCGTILGFTPNDAGGVTLTTANFCRVRLCPTCMWRRSLKLQAQVSSIMDAMKADGKEYAFVYVTLTIKNMKGDKLGRAMDAMNKGFRRLMQTKEVKDMNHGFMKCIEVTHNVEQGSKDFDTFHPHIHILLAVNPSYFKGKKYIKQERWTELWQKAMRLSYTPRVDVRRVKGNTAKAVAEAAGYSAKASSFILPDDWDLTLATVDLLDKVLDGRRLVGFGGEMREYQRRLKLDDPEDGDLVHVTGEEKDQLDRSRETFYAWFSGYRQYRELV